MNNPSYIMVTPGNVILTITVTVTFLVGVVTCYIFHPAISAYRHRRPLPKVGVGLSSSQLNDSGTYVKEEVYLSQSRDKVTPRERNLHLLSIIIPCYNEQERLPPMLQTTLNDIISSKKEIIRLCTNAIPMKEKSRIDSASYQCPFEVIIVNDGSKDGTVSAVRDLVSSYEFGDNKELFSIRLLSLTQNSGKGAAVRTGMINSNSELCLMVDADGATEFNSGIKHVLTKMADAGSSDMKVVFGSRAHLQDESKAKRSFARTVLMHSFHFFVKTFCSNNVKDTQCGFKLFTRSAAFILFQNLHLTRWAFDTEVVVLAEMLGIPILEVGVSWEEVDGSKLATNKISLVLSSMGMLRDMICVKLCYTLGIWEIEKQIHD